MFIDLTDEDIQPVQIQMENVPNVTFSEDLNLRLKDMFDEEEQSFAKVAGMTTSVRIDKNYVYFSNQWYFLAVSCKKYALSLYQYCDFFDSKIRKNDKAMACLEKRNYLSPDYTNLFDNSEDAVKMQKFIEGDPEFRKGKALLNEDSKTKTFKPRSCKDIFGSCVLKALQVPDASSGYLGNVIYYLAKRPELFNSIEYEIRKQIGLPIGSRKLPSSTKDCAKAIIDDIYSLDKFENLASTFLPTEKFVKIDTSILEEDTSSSRSLRYIFARPSSGMFEPLESDDSKPGVFTDNQYEIRIGENVELCRLSTEWKDVEVSSGKDGNNLRALIEIVNLQYKSYVKIISILGERYLIHIKQKFVKTDLPDAFQSSFATRYIKSLLAKPFTILTGNSGTGKTRIAQQFAEYLEIKDEMGQKNWEIVPVGADWTDNTKILGFFNPFGDGGKGKYQKTVILNLIERASTHRELPYFLILDEMNLSHVERYFSDFLSHMETEGNPFVLDGYEGQLYLPDNLFVVGTVNIDETTYMFSPKVLDRANVVEFKPDKESVIGLFDKEGASNKILPAVDGSSEAFLTLARKIRTDIKNQKICFDLLKNVFGQIYLDTEKCGFEFAYRTVKEVSRYILAAFEISDLDVHTFNLDNLVPSIDEQLLQKVLPKIHGNRKEVGNMLTELKSLCSDIEGTLTKNGVVLGEEEKEILAEHNQLPLSLNKITAMEGKLANVQFASFI